MTICIATSNFSPQTGGIATFYDHLSATLSRQGNNVLVLTADTDCKPGMEDEIVIRNGITIILLRKNYSTLSAHYSKYFPPGSLNASYWIAAGMAMKNWLLQNHQQYGIDIVEVSDYGGLGIFLMESKLPPVVVTGHGAFIQLKQINNIKTDSHTVLVSQLEKLSFREADGVITHSPANRSDLESLAGREISFITAPWRELEQDNIITPGEDVLVAGGLQKVKGAITMTEAVREISLQNKNIKAYWAGGDTFTAPGAARMSLFLKNKYPGIWDRSLVWLQELSHNETIRKISGSGIVVIPSLWEVFSYVALEAAFLKKPIIMTSTTGASYLFKHGFDALIIPPNDPVQLAQAILYLQESPSVREKLGQNAAETVRKVFLEKNTITDRINLYNRIIKNRKQAPNPANLTIPVLKKFVTPQRRYFFLVKKILKSLLRW
ncbi:MAG: glycosyltransferase family 4 protein [Sphingobacteriales bacterium]|nr:glycosyltransferase family 4 protein [Sphingobacteriales bacterium]